ELDNNPDDYDTLLQWLCAHLGGDCDDPTGQLVRVPACRGDTYADCKGNIEAKGLTVQRVDLDFDTADIDVPAERVVKTAPATQADAGSEVKVYVNPNSATMPSAQERDEACELTTPLGHDPAPSRGGDAAPGTPTWIAYFDNYPNDATPQTFKRKTGNLVTDLTGGVDTYLRWGWTKALPEPKRWGDFGYRHIAAKHGWTVADQLATQVALNLPPIDVQGTTYVYLGPEYPGPVAGAICKRRVVVQTRPDYQGKAKEILTSYGQLQSSS
ncbi:MAG: hypothetical protein QOJ31_157, partial [Gaiellales bacterium]|nr:hypothetical protein [Gaiellales bacterium]